MPMPSPSILPWLLLAIPLLAAALCAVVPKARTLLLCAWGGVWLAAGTGAVTAAHVFGQGTLVAAAGWLRVDALSAYHLIVMDLVFAASSLYAHVYFGEELASGRLAPSQARRLAVLWCSALAAMTGVLVSNNLGMMWVSMEATTLFTAFLISLHPSDESLEAMWKYILICSIGVAFAFLGTLLFSAAYSQAGIEAGEPMLWTTLQAHAASLDPSLVKLAFVFILVGYGTKAGLAPVHNWLPDAHSQAPAPVSAIFSGFMLNAALYCIMRYLPIAEIATANVGWARHLIGGIGLLSIGVAAAFILFQGDLKRLLAYHSVEHLGIIAVGLGLGGLGTFAALFHTLNHSLCKALAFFAAGRLGQRYGSHDMERINGALRVSSVWGVAILASLLALVGVAPFALFMSEFQIVWAAVQAGAYTTLILFLLGAGIVFAGALSHVIPLVFGPAPSDVRSLRATSLEWALVGVPLLVLLGLGIDMPAPLQSALHQAAVLIDPGNTLAAPLVAVGGLP